MITEQRKNELYELAENHVREILSSCWKEIGSWDGLLEDEVLTIDELQWIWSNCKPAGHIE